MAGISKAEIVNNAQEVIERARLLQGLVTHKGFRELEIIIENKEQILLVNLNTEEGVSDFERGKVVGLRELIDDITAGVEAGESETQTLNKL